MNLDQVCFLRSNELTRILAGCVGINPPLILPMLSRLRESALTDDHARQFILAMKARLPDLLIGDEDQQIEITIRTASDLHFLSDYALWITLVDYLTCDAKAAIDELEGLEITQHTLASLSKRINTAMRRSENAIDG